MIGFIIGFITGVIGLIYLCKTLGEFKTLYDARNGEENGNGKV